MGMYTEIYINVDLKEDIPKEVLAVLEAMCNHDTEAYALLGLPHRWGYLFGNGSYYTPSTSVSNLTYDDITKQYSLLGKGDIKNYENEIEAFFKWLMPYIDAYEGEFIGYSRYEEDDIPTLYFKKGE